jgi:hypothetical protein
VAGQGAEFKCPWCAEPSVEFHAKHKRHSKGARILSPVLSGPAASNRERPAMRAGTSDSAVVGARGGLGSAFAGRIWRSVLLVIEDLHGQGGHFAPLLE